MARVQHSWLRLASAALATGVGGALALIRVAALLRCSASLLASAAGLLLTAAAARSLLVTVLTDLRAILSLPITFQAAAALFTMLAQLVLLTASMAVLTALLEFLALPFHGTGAAVLLVLVAIVRVHLQYSCDQTPVSS